MYMKYDTSLTVITNTVQSTLLQYIMHQNEYSTYSWKATLHIRTF